MNPSNMADSTPKKNKINIQLVENDFHNIQSTHEQ